MWIIIFCTFIADIILFDKSLNILDVQTQPGQEVERSVPQGQCLLEIDNQCEAQSKQTEKGPGKTKKR
jgi:hypothetical protein